MRRRKGRKRAVDARAPAAVLAPPNQRWSRDFVYDQIARGRRFRVLNIVDDVTRERLVGDFFGDKRLVERRESRQ